MIEVRALSRSYDTLTAVDAVSFDINHGEIVGLLGHNGAGKTTMMKMLTGYLEPSAGSIRIHGLDINQNRRAIQRHIGYLPENCPLYPDMTVLDYLDYQAALHGLIPPHRASAIRQAIERTELGAKVTATIGTLSRGYRQRVGVAAAILHAPSILILDEPTNGLDPAQIQHMRALVRELSVEATLLISTHVLQEVEAVCERVLILRNGRLALDSPLNAIGESRLIVTLDRPLGEVAPLLSDIAGVNAVIELEIPFENKSPQPPLLKGGEEAPLYKRGVEEISNGGWGINLHRFALTTADPRTVAPAIAAAIGQRGWALYELTPERHNLEALFGAVTLAAAEKNDV
ncbi:ABC transporter ATP-binding protein [Chromatium okenii]|uniref:ABC transporter ATP-binding protein n=1 Tax=Chromatium okenii TaxID=61644 RepID=UPI0026EBB370|nr:ATP-binding cassette domain-containing protein [Chromatium okenii]MBV5310315.1 ATP-binding cassette domain-containing protein [Chromatium okenii]